MIDITADSIRLITINDDGEEEIKNVLDLFLLYSHISTVTDVNIPIGGGLYYTLKEWVGTISDDKIPGLASLIEYLNTNFRKVNDDSIINNYYTITNKHENVTNNQEYTYHKNITQKNTTSKLYKITIIIINHKYITQKKYNEQIIQNNDYNYHKNITNKHYNETIIKQDNFTYSKHITKKNITNKQIQCYINIENNFTYIKQNNQALIVSLQQQINNLETQLNSILSSLNNP